MSPKACGHTRGRKVVSREEAVMRIKAAVDARSESGSDIVIVARSDARQGVSLEEALVRTKLFADAGADVCFIDALGSVEEMKAFCQVAPRVPKLANMLERGGKTPILNPQELDQVGYKLAVYPLSLMGVSIRAMQAKWYYYILLGLVDVEANFLVVKAYQYTSLTSVMLLDCWSIPCVMLLTWIFLKTKYRFKKITGVIVCIAGLVLVVFSDVHAGDRAGGSNPRLGDVLVIAGATLYAFSNVSEEFLVKNADREELMAMLGLFGGIISAIQIAILERNELKSIHWSAGAAFPFFGFSVAMFLFYSLVPVLLKLNGSTMLNLSLLTSDMWSVLIRIFAYHEKVDWMYYLAFGAVVIGIVIYSIGFGDEDQNPANAVEEPVAIRQDEEASSATHSKGNVSGSSKTWVA